MGGAFVSLFPDSDVREAFEKFCFVQVHPPENRAYASWSLPASEDSDQYKINLGGSSYTVADYAYTDAKVAIYIDGLSENLHGDPGNNVKDRRLRAVLVEKVLSIFQV